MFSESLSRRNVASRILGISALIGAIIAGGCNSGSGYGGGGGGSPSLAAAVASPGTFSSGEQGASYTITVSNTGTAATSGTVTVADPPTGFTITAMSGAGWTCTLTMPTTTCTYSSLVAAAQSFPPITVTGNVTAANGTPISIPLTLSGGGAPSVNVNPTPSVNVAAVALAITKSHMGAFTQGQTGATYTLKVSNGTAAGTTSGTVTVAETLPSGFAPGSPFMAGSGWTCPGAGGANTCDRSDVLTGGSSYPAITVTVNVSAIATSPQVNQVSVSGGNQVGTVGPVSDSTTINPPPALQISKSHTGNFTVGCGPKPGTVHCPPYTVTVSNKPGPAAGPTDGSTVTVTEFPPTGLTVTGMTGPGWNCPVRTNTCLRSDVLAAGASYPVILVTVIVSSNAASPLVNSVQVSGGGDSVGSNTTDPSVILPASVLRIAKTHSGSFTRGQQGATYAVTVSNTGTLPTSGTVTVTETVPSGLTLVSMAGVGWTCPSAGVPNTCDRSDVLGTGTPAPTYPTITVTVNVATSASSPQVNAVAVSGGGSANDSTTDSTTITSGTTCPLPLLNNESLLTGTYIAILSGWKDGGGPSQMVAAFAANGSGVVTNGEMDSGEIVFGAAQAPPTLTTISSGCYQLGPDDRGLMIWNLTGGGSVTFAISVSPNDQGGASDFLMEFDDANPGTSPGTRLAGRFYSQIGGPFSLASFSGPLAFYTTGYSPNSDNTDYIRSGTVGRLDDSLTGLVTNGALNVGLTIATGTQSNFDNQSFTGTFGQPDSLGRGLLTLNFTSFGTLGPLTFKFAYYISDVNDLYLQSLDTPDNTGHSLQNGDVVTQVPSSFTPAVLSGKAILFMAGADLSTSHSFAVTDVGQVNSHGTGDASVMLDEISNGSALCMGNSTISGGSFVVSPNGMGVLTIGPSACAKTFSIAMFDQNSGYMLEGTATSPGSNILTGSLRPQTAPASGFGDATFLGVYVFGIHNQASTNSIFGVGSAMTPTPQTTPPGISGTIDDSSGSGCNTGCLSSNQAVSATYSVDANGRITIPMPGLSGGTSVGWFANMGKRFILISDTNSANATILNSNH